MCGIAGIVRFDDQPIERRRLEAMRDHLRHRGPDGEGIAAYERCALVHTRLAIIDLLSGQQPMHVARAADLAGGASGGGPLHLVFNGEIYNHRALRQQLEKLGHRFTSDHSDTEVLLLGYRQWGLELPKHLHGMFAFAIWDEDAQRLVLVRDRTGKKPLYVFRRDRELCFASLAATVRAGLPSGLRPGINPSALRNYLRLGYTFRASLIDGIEEIAAAHLMVVDAQGAVTTHQYWQPPPISLTSTSLGAVASTREVLMEAVSTRLEADVPLGCFLSGGIDSSVIAALAQRKLQAEGRGPLHTFSVAMPDLDYDESRFAQRVARAIGAEHVRLEADPSHDIVGDLTRLVAIAGEPLADSSILPTHWLSRATRQHVKVALSGDGGDELFGGYDRYRALWLLQRLRGILRLAPTGMLTAVEPRSRRARLRRLREAARFDTPARQYLSMVHLFTDEQIASLGVATQECWSGGESGGVPGWPAEAEPVSAARRWDLTHYLPFVLMRKVDRASMAVALEVRCPMLDTAVCDLAGHLPTTVLMPRGRRKALLRAIASELLPAEIVRRPKRGFAVPIGRWFAGPLQQTLRDIVTDGTLDAMGFERNAIVRLVDEHVQHKADHTHRLFALLDLAIWGRWLGQ